MTKNIRVGLVTFSLGLIKILPCKGSLFKSKKKNSIKKKIQFCDRNENLDQHIFQTVAKDKSVILDWLCICTFLAFKTIN